MRPMRPLHRLSTRLLVVFFGITLFWGCASAPRNEPRSAPQPELLEEAEERIERGASEGSGSDPLPEKADAEARPSFLYRIEGGLSDSYLLGTIHLGVGFYENLGPEALEQIGTSRVIYTELSSDPDTAEIAAQFFLGEGAELRALLGEARFERLASRVSSLPREYLNRLKPWAALVFASVQEYQQYQLQIGGDPSVSMDTELQAFAKERGIPNVGLETAKEQLDAFESIALAEVIALVDELVDRPLFEEARALLEAYRSGDEAALLEALDMERSRERAPAYYEKLLRARNHRWLETLGPELKEGAITVGVGAAHLFYEDGLIKLIEDAGYNVVKLP